jgi:hypothetical protein
VITLSFLQHPSTDPIARICQASGAVADAARVAAHHPRARGGRAGAGGALPKPFCDASGRIPVRASRARAVHVSCGLQPAEWIMGHPRPERNGRRVRLQLRPRRADLVSYMRARNGRTRSGHGRVHADSAGLRHLTILRAVYQLLLVHRLPTVCVGPARRLLHRSAHGHMRSVPWRHLPAHS